MKNLFANTAKLIKDAINKRKYQLQEMAIGLKDQHPKSVGALQAAVGLGSLVIIGCGSAELAAKLSDKPPKRPSMELELGYVPNTTQNTTTSDIEQAVTEALTQNTTEEPTYTTTVKPVENPTEPVVTTIPVYNETDIVTTETTTYYVDPTTNTVKTTTTTRQPSTQATTTKKQTTATTPKQTTKVTTVTTQKVTQPSTQAPTQPNYDYKIEDIANDGAAFCQFSHKLNGDLLRGNGIGLTYGVTYGGLESKIVLAILNHGAISDEVIKDVFNCYTIDEIRNGIEFIYSIQKIEDYYGTRIDYSEYTIDKEIGTYINKISDAKKNGHIDEFVLKTLTPNAVPTKITDHTAIKAMLATYDNQYMSKEIANEIGVDEFANEITKIALGKSYSR